MAAQPGHDAALIVGISGPSSSGKTTLARLLQTVFGGLHESLKTFIIHEDDFYLPDDKIPYTTTRSGARVQDWDCAAAIDISALAAALSHVRQHGCLPAGLQSKEDHNEASDSGVDRRTLDELRRDVCARLHAGLAARPAPLPQRQRFTLAFLEGFLLYAPPQTPSAAHHQQQHYQHLHQHVLWPIYQNIQLPLFLPAPYDLVKARRERRSGYVTIGPAGAALPQRIAAASESSDTRTQLPEQNFWVDPPGYVDDVVWPRYVQDHAWLLLPAAASSSDRDSSAEGTDSIKRGTDQGSEHAEDAQEDAKAQDTNAHTVASAAGVQDLVAAVGQAVDLRTDLGVHIAPGRGSLPMTDVLKWAVDEIMAFWEIRIC